MPGRLRDPSPAARGRRFGDSAEAAADVSPAENRGASAALDEQAGPYEDWTLVELRRRASADGIAGRSGMRKDDLIRALRSSSGRASEERIP